MRTTLIVLSLAVLASGQTPRPGIVDDQDHFVPRHVADTIVPGWAVLLGWAGTDMTVSVDSFALRKWIDAMLARDSTAFHYNDTAAVGQMPYKGGQADRLHELWAAGLHVRWPISSMGGEHSERIDFRARGAVLSIWDSLNPLVQYANVYRDGFEVLDTVHRTIGDVQTNPARRAYMGFAYADVPAGYAHIAQYEKGKATMVAETSGGGGQARVEVTGGSGGSWRDTARMDTAGLYTNRRIVARDSVRSDLVNATKRIQTPLGTLDSLHSAGGIDYRRSWGYGPALNDSNPWARIFSRGVKDTLIAGARNLLDSATVDGAAIGGCSVNGDTIMTGPAGRYSIRWCLKGDTLTTPGPSIAFAVWLVVGPTRYQQVAQQFVPYRIGSSYHVALNGGMDVDLPPNQKVHLEVTPSAGWSLLGGTAKTSQCYLTVRLDED